MLISPFFWACGVAPQACPNEALAKLMYPLHLLTGSPSLPSPLTVTLPLTARLKNPITSPVAPADPWPKQIILGSQPHKGGESKILWQGTWGIPAMRPSIRIWNWFNT